MTDLVLHPVGYVESVLTDRAVAPRQPDEGAPDAWLVLDDHVAEALEGLGPGDDVVLLTWLDRADRDVLAVHPRGDEARPLTGVFATRSPDLGLRFSPWVMGGTFACGQALTAAILYVTLERAHD